MSQKFIDAGFKKGCPNCWGTHPEKMRKARAKGGQSLHQTWEEERRRVRMGLPQKTRLKVTSDSDRKTMLAKNTLRWFLRKRGYRIEGEIAYWNENTARALQTEKKNTLFKYRMEEREILPQAFS